MDMFQEMARLTSRRVPFVIVTVVETGGSSPQKPGARMLVVAGGETLGTIGGGAIEYRAVEAARALLADPERSTELLQVNLVHDLGMCCGGRMGVFLEKVAPEERLVIFGAGHVGQALAGFAVGLGFRVTVVDARPEQLNAERFPRAERVLGDPVEAIETLGLDETDYACVMTHDHPLDQRVVEALVTRPLRYIGMIGSLRKAERCRLQMSTKGFPAEQIARLRSPMGVHIGAQSAAEIAISIAAGLVAIRQGVEIVAAKPRPIRAPAQDAPDASDDQVA